MKTRLFSMLCAVMLLCCACGGSETKTASSTPAKTIDLPTLMTELTSTAAIDDPLILGESDMLDFYGIEAAQMKQFSAQQCSNGISAQEIVLVEAVDEAAASAIQEQLEKRLSSRMAESKDYLPDEYEIISGCEVVRDGLYVRLIIHAEEDALVDLYNKTLGN